MNKREGIAWAAGIFEGEGCFTFSAPGRRLPSPFVRVQMTDKDVIEKFASVVERGTVLGPYFYEGENYRMTKPQWSWSLNGYDGFVYIRKLFWPYLCERRRQRALEIEQIYLNSRTNVTNKGTICKEDGCTRDAICKHQCFKHYQRAKRVKQIA